jgi:hypothetical protein
MKAIVKLTVLFAALLLVTGVAFAWCNCFEVRCTNLDHPDMKPIIHNVEFCLDPEYPTSQSNSFAGLCNDDGAMVLFFDAMKLQALAFSTENNPLAYLKFHGDWPSVVNGIVFCYGDRWSMRGHVVDPDECRPPA